MMQDKLDNVLLLFIAAGWPERRILENIEGFRELPPREVSKRVKALKKTLSNHRNPATAQRDTRDRAVSAALKLLRSAGPYTESEIIEAIAIQAGPDILRKSNVQKGGVRDWLVSLADEIGADRMSKIVKQARNELVHNPRPGWTINDVD